MKTNRIVMVVALVLLAALAGTVMFRGVGQANAPRRQRIELNDGRRVEGSLVRVRQGAYLLQNREECLLLNGDQIRRVDGRGVGEGGFAVAEHATLETETFEVVGPDGSLEVHSRIQKVNDGQEALARLDWGVAPHEVELLANWRVIDQFGNELRPQIEDDPSTHGKRVRVELPRPVLPGERLAFIDIIRFREGVTRQGGVWVYRHRGDYPEDRLVTRSVLLPQGAAIVSVTPDPVSDVTVGGRRLVVWRRYYRAGEVGPWEIRYRL